MRSRVSVFGFIALLSGLISTRGVAQDSPEFGDDEEPVAEAYDSGDQGGDAPLADDTSMSSETPAPSPDPGYASSAAEVDISGPAVETGPDLAPGLQLGVELGAFAGGGDEGSRLTLSPIATLGIGLSNSVQAGVTWGFNYQSNGAPDTMPAANSESAFVAGNPQLWVARHSQSGRTHFVLGGGITLPVASLPEDPIDQGIAAQAYLHASALRGDWNAWMWTTDHAAGFVSFAGHAVLDELLIGGETAVAVLAPTRGGEEMGALGQAAAEAGYATDTVRVVMRAQAVGIVSPVVDDEFQFSIDPYVAWNVSSATTLSARWTVNLDAPTGVDHLGIWGLRLGANITL